jgi:hypothetical protein
MQSLFEYAAAIHHQPSRMQIVRHRSEQSSWKDQDVTVRHHATTYEFADGVLIRRSVELDECPSEAVCAECWITYEVLADGAAAAPVSPRRQAFDNPCRETFWLRYHNA